MKLSIPIGNKEVIKSKSKLWLARYVVRFGDFIDTMSVTLVILPSLVAFLSFMSLAFSEIPSFEMFVWKVLKYETIIFIVLYSCWEIHMFWNWITDKSTEYLRKVSDGSYK